MNLSYSNKTYFRNFMLAISICRALIILSNSQSSKYATRLISSANIIRRIMLKWIENLSLSSQDMPLRSLEDRKASRFHSAASEKVVAFLWKLSVISYASASIQEVFSIKSDGFAPNFSYFIWDKSNYFKSLFGCFVSEILIRDRRRWSLKNSLSWRDAVRRWFRMTYAEMLLIDSFHLKSDKRTSFRERAEIRDRMIVSNWMLDLSPDSSCDCSWISEEEQSIILSIFLRLHDFTVSTCAGMTMR